MKKRTTRRILSLATVFALVMSMMLTANAADQSLTRGEMTKMLADGVGLSAQAASYAQQDSAFRDVAEGSEYEGYINLAYAKGLISGTGGGNFSPDAKATQAEAAAVMLKYFGLPAGLMKAWPADYNELAVWSGLAFGVNYEGGKAITADEFAKMLANGPAVSKKPIIGISWKSNEQDYAPFKTVLREAGGIPVELPQIICTDVGYDAEGVIQPNYVEKSGNLKQSYADVVKSRDYAKSNVAQAVADVDGLFFTGGEDVSPSLFATPMPEANEGEEINATRDISDYTLMAYALDHDIPTLGVCRGEQVLGIVSGCTFIQDITNHYEAQGKPYGDLHRMPVGTPNRTYARHDVDISRSSKWLYDIVGDTQLANVSSWHHQAVDGVEGTNLTVAATTEHNGVEIVEAIERQDKTFCLGVQFHPENDAKTVLYDGKEAICDYDTCMEFFETLVAYAADKPVIGISWKSNEQDYAAFKTVIRAAGGIPAELAQVTSTAVAYDDAMEVEDAYLAESGNLKQEYADVIKSKDFSKSNVADVVAFKNVDGLFFTGGEDVSPSLFAVPQEEANEGEEINATRDISDYTLMAYALDQDIPTLGVCRGEQVLGIVSGCTFIQDINNYYKDQGQVYEDLHRMPVGTPNRTYARHDVDISPESKWLYDIVGDTKLANVSSWHHQAIEGVEGTNLTVAATTEHNGVTIVEAVERPDKTFCLGVQFHPENDCKTVLYDGKEAICDFDTCMNFFYTLMEYAGK